MVLLFGTLRLFFFFRRRRFVLNNPNGISINLGFLVRAILPFSGIRNLTDLLARAMAVLSARVYLFTLALTFSVLECFALPTETCLGLPALGFFFWEAQALRPVRPRQHLDQSRLHFQCPPHFQWDHNTL